MTKLRILLLAISIVSCATTHDERVHLKSVETHDLAIKIGEHVSDKIESISKHAHMFSDPLKSLLQDSVEILEQDYAYWESTIMEVPGHEHVHHDHAGHDHNHSPTADLTPEMILNIQRDLRDRIVKLNIRTQRLLNTIDKMKNNEPVKEKEKASSYGA